MNDSIAHTLQTFFEQYKLFTYPRGHVLIRGGQQPEGIYFIKEGKVKMYAISTRGEEVTLNNFRQHAFFPMSWALNDTENNYFFEAVSEVTVYKAPKQDVLKFLQHNPEVVFDLLKRVFSGTDGLLARMTYLMSGNAHERLIIELIIAARRFGKKNLDSHAVTLHISEIDLSHHTGLTRETVSREMKVLKTNNLVTFDKHILTIHDLSQLETYLNEQ